MGDGAHRQRGQEHVIITGLKAGTRYEVQVRAREPRRAQRLVALRHGVAESRTWRTGTPHSPPAPTRSAWPRTRCRTPTSALRSRPSIRDGDTLTYSLEGVDADSFDILVDRRRQARYRRKRRAEPRGEGELLGGGPRVRDGRGGTDAVNVTIRVTDENGEAPDTPFAPTVTALSSTSLQVIWEAPANDGPPITDYDYRYQRAVSDSNWTEVIEHEDHRATTVTIEGLAASTSYDVEVRATNAEGTSDWSNPGNRGDERPRRQQPARVHRGN